MTNTDHNAPDLEAQYERASAYLKRIEKKLFEAVRRLEDETSPLGETSKDLEQITARLEKTAFKLFEIGYKLEEQKQKHQGATVVLDLDAAKREIIERLRRGASRKNTAPSSAQTG